MTHSLRRSDVRSIAKSLRMSVRYVDREYRVNFSDGSEATAYYTNDARDAIDTMLAMRAHADHNVA